MAESGSLLGTVLDLEIGAPGHGGFCVARHEGRVVFVRHALPGELVRARVTEDNGGSYCRADAVEVVRASADRVEAPCPYAGPGRCGGCDWQHVSADGQRELKRQVVLEQFRRFASMDVAELLTEVEELPGGVLGWRTRITYAVDREGQVGLHPHRSHEVEPVEQCLLGVPGVGDGEELAQQWPGLNALEILASGAGDGATTVIGHRPGPARKGRGRRAPDRLQVLAGPAYVRHQVGGHDLLSSADGFWQVHQHALATFTSAVLDMAGLVPGEHVLELYAGSGALTVSLADAVGPGGKITAYEGNATAVADAEQNLTDLAQASVAQARVDAALIERAVAEHGRPAVVVLDPPRSGAGEAVMQALVEVASRGIVYVACDPVALARDVAASQRSGWRLVTLRAFDAFPMTHHVECVALLVQGLSP